MTYFIELSQPLICEYITSIVYPYSPLNLQYLLAEGVVGEAGGAEVVAVVDVAAVKDGGVASAVH